MTQDQAEQFYRAIERILEAVPIGGVLLHNELERRAGLTEHRSSSRGMAARTLVRLAERGIIFRPEPLPRGERRAGSSMSYRRLPPQAPGPATLRAEDIRNLMGSPPQKKPDPSRIRLDWSAVALGCAVGLGIALVAWMVSGVGK